MSAAQAGVSKRELPRVYINWQSRYRLIVSGGIALLVALLVIVLAVSAYNTAYALFESIAVVNSTNVDAAEQALQYLANASQATADYAALTSDTPLFEQAQNNIFRNFHRFRDEMFILRENLHTPEDETAFTVADTYTYSRFWRHVSNLLSQRSNIDAARREYLSADNHLRNRIIPALQELEKLNFQAMVDEGERAEATITSQVIALAIPAVGLALGLTVLSFWLRQKVRRYLTPGIDAAAILGWVLIGLIVLNLTQMPGQLRTMIRDSYYSISGSSRVLVVANQANRAESSTIIDFLRPKYWYQIFDDNVQSVELRLCGAPGCTDQSFLASGTADTPNPSAVSTAQQISESSEILGGLVPLMANITFAGEAAALERARLAFLDYRAVNTQLRDLMKANDLTSAVELNTRADAGGSEEAFGRFVQAIEQVRSINRAIFDDIWNTQREALPRNQLLFGVAGYLVVMVFIILGVYHRYREL
jgi:hypothetical protein